MIGKVPLTKKLITFYKKRAKLDEILRKLLKKLKIFKELLMWKWEENNIELVYNTQIEHLQIFH
jgi:hypothetical protein